MTSSERIAALQDFGYNSLEAQFLTLAALQSGYFLRRQFLSFTKGIRGSKDVAFLNKLKATGHCRALVYRQGRTLYHLSSKTLYDAIGEPECRNRREHQPSTIKNKVMALDFVLDHPDAKFLLTEREKVNYFVETRSISKADLPARLYSSPQGHDPAEKHFVDGYPISLERVVPNFCFIDEGTQTSDRFATYLSQYRRLLQALGEFRVVYVAESPRLFASAGRIFEKLGRAFDPESDRIQAYFRRRHAYENRDFTSFDTAALIRYREEKAQFSGDRYEDLYARWKVTEGLPGEAISKRFSLYLLPYNYDLFGTLTSRNGKRSNTEISTELS